MLVRVVTPSSFLPICHSVCQPHPRRYRATASGAKTITIFSGDADERFEFGIDVVIRGLATYASAD
jgi:Tetracyclin repressor-like, C-terminal domain